MGFPKFAPSILGAHPYFWKPRNNGPKKIEFLPFMTWRQTNPNGERHWANGLSLQYVEGEPEEARGFCRFVGDVPFFLSSKVWIHRIFVDF